MVEPGFGSMGQSEPSAGEMDLDEVEQEVGPGVSIQNNSQPQTQKVLMESEVEPGVGKSTNSKTPNISLVFILYKEQDECICTLQCTEYYTKPSSTVRAKTGIKY